MKHYLLLITLLALMAGCGSKTTKPADAEEATDSTATVASDGVVEIERVEWDELDEESFATLLDNAKWKKSDDGVRYPDFMTPSDEIFVEDVPGSVYRWDYGDVCLCCWPMLGAWAVTDHPDVDNYLTDKVKVKSITYSNSKGNIFSGFADDGRIWYMKKVLLPGGEVVHAKFLVLLYPKSMQSEVTELIDAVKAW